MFLVSFPVPGNLCNPVIGVVAASKGGPQLIPVPAVPEIAVTENDHSSHAEYQIRVPRQLGDVLSVKDTQLP